MVFADYNPQTKSKNVDLQKVQRRERNREHAKRSRIRKRLLLDSLQSQLVVVREENAKLRRVLSQGLPPTKMKTLLSDLGLESTSPYYDSQYDSTITSSDFKPSKLTANLDYRPLLPKNSIDILNQANEVISKAGGSDINVEDLNEMDKKTAKQLLAPDYRLMESLMVAQQNYCLTDPSLPGKTFIIHNVFSFFPELFMIYFTISYSI